MPCIFTFFANETVPTIDLDSYGSTLDGAFDLQIECQKNADDDFFY